MSYTEALSTVMPVAVRRQIDFLHLYPPGLGSYVYPYRELALSQSVKQAGAVYFFGGNHSHSSAPVVYNILTPLVPIKRRLARHAIRDYFKKQCTQFVATIEQAYVLRFLALLVDTTCKRFRWSISIRSSLTHAIQANPDWRTYQ